MSQLQYKTGNANESRFVVVVMRAFGVANLCFVARGSWLIYETLRGYARVTRMPPDLSVRPPGFSTAFLTLTSINAGLLMLLLCAGFLLIGLRRRAVLVCNVVFIAEIILFLIPTPVPATNLLRALSAASAVGNMGIAPQILTGYPILGLLVLNLLGRSRKLKVPSTASA